MAEGDPPILSSNSEEEDNMAAPQPLTMGDYCKQTDEGYVSRGFVLADPANFDIKHFVILGLRDNPFDGNAIRDPWAHLARFYETASMCRLDGVLDDQIKLQLKKRKW